MNDFEFKDVLAGVLSGDYDLEDFDLDQCLVRGAQEAGYLTRDATVEIRFPNGDTFLVTVQQAR